jgi:hypothetical protein
MTCGDFYFECLHSILPELDIVLLGSVAAYNPDGSAYLPMALI